MPGAQYGSRLKAPAVYLSAVHLLPWQRTTQVQRDLTSAGMGEGALGAALEHRAAGVAGVVEAIRQVLADADVAHFDETVARIAPEAVAVGAGSGFLRGCSTSNQEDEQEQHAESEADTLDSVCVHLG